MTLTYDKPSAPDLHPQRRLSFAAPTLPVQANMDLQAMQRSEILKVYKLNTAEGNFLKAEVTGTTHPVGIDANGSLFDGRELATYEAGREIEIDPNHAQLSRRGANQEIMLERKQDFYSEPEHVWYPEYSKNPADYKKEGWPYVRADTLKVNEALDSLIANSPRRAAPTDGYEKIEKISAAQFIESQEKYQNKLLENYSKKQIMASHRSVGFEYEFAGHTKKDAEAHISLATSDKHSQLFGLKFELETDSGEVVEIGMPPFIVPNLPNGNLDKTEIKAIHAKMEEAMAGVEKKLQNGDVMELDEFIDLLRREGMGKGWTVSDDSKKLNNIRIVKAPPKLSDGIYPQMNISMNGDESAELILGIEERYRHEMNFAEKGVLGETYREINSEAVKFLGKELENEPLPSHFVHLNKALASAVAIPSILFKNSIPKNDKHDISSAVKELSSVWVKDYLPNVLATTSASPGELNDLKDFAKQHALPVVKAKLDGLLKEYCQNGYAHPEKTQHINKWDVMAKQCLMGSPKFSDTCMNTIGGDGPLSFAGSQVTSDVWQKFQEWRDSGEDDEIKEQLNELMETGMGRFRSECFDKTGAEIMGKLNKMIDEIGSSEVIGVSEASGGVRIDTYIAQEPGSSADLRSSVTEARSRQVMAKALEEEGN